MNFQTAEPHKYIITHFVKKVHLFLEDFMSLEKINNFIWGNGLLFLLLSTGLFLTLKFKLIQLRLPFLLKKHGKSENFGLSQFRTVCMSLGTAMGTGNIVGAASAVAVGGAGAVFWMWISAFLGMALVYAENVLSSIYSDNELKGPMAYLTKGLGLPFYAMLFAIFCVCASLGMGGMAQISVFAEALGDCTDYSRPIAALLIFCAVWLVTSGGGKRIGAAAQLLLPAASVIYTIACIAVMVVNFKNIPQVFADIFREAFTFDSAVGGFGGYALSIGIRRGLFSNEAGLGSSPILHSAAEDGTHDTQALWSMFEVFFDTIVCCTLTAVTVLCASENFSPAQALSTVMGDFSAEFIAAELGVFSFCTVIGWYFCGAAAFRHIFKGKYIAIYTLIYSVLAAVGALSSAESVWLISDIFNGLMAFVNISGIVGIILFNRSARAKLYTNP